MLSCLNELGYMVEWRVINAADYGMPQRRRRVFIFAYHKSSPIYKKYKSIKIDVTHLPYIYSFIPKPNGVNNLKLLIYSLKDILKLPIGLIQILNLIKK